MSDELKPCPFCGGEAHQMKMGWPHRVYCEDCGAMVTGKGFVWEGETDAAVRWNARAERTCEMLRMPTGEKAAYSDTDEVIWHCRFCHAESAAYAFDEDGAVWAAVPKFCPECGAKVVGWWL